MIFIAGCSMGKVTAKIMRDAKEARTMGDAGVDGGSESGGMFNVDESYPGGAPPAEFNPEVGRFETNLPADKGPAIPGPEGTVSPAGGAGVQAIPEPKAWEATVEKAAEKGEQPSITRKKRRRSLLTEEEGGVLGTAPIYRRSILGR